MFKKLVSNLPFSPSLIRQLGFYARRLKKEQVMRRLGLVFTVFALIIQSFAIFVPPESANASSSNDIVPGGFSSKAQAVAKYSENSPGGRRFRVLLSHNSISASNIASVTSCTIGKNDGYTSFGNISYSGSKKVSYTESSGTYVYYSRPLSTVARSNTFKALCGTASNGAEFAILMACGNLELKPPPAPKPTAVCDRLEVTPAKGTAGKTVYSFAVWGTTNTSWSGYRYDWTGPVNGTTGWKPGSSTRLSIPANNFPKAGKYTVRAILKTPTNSNVTNNTTCVKTIVVEAPPAPTATCQELTVKTLSRTEYQLTASATVANGATVKNYQYTSKDSNNKVVFSKTSNGSVLKHTLTATLPNNTSVTTDAKYTTSVTIGTSVGDKTSAACSKIITIPKLPACPYNPELPADDPKCKAPSASCDLLTAEPVSGSATKYKLSTKSTTANGAKITEYIYTVKDASGKVVITQNVKSSSVNNSVEINLPTNTSIKDSVKYTISVTVKTSLGDKTSTLCATEIEIPPKPVCKYDPKLPADDPGCVPPPPEMCSIPGKGNLPKNDPGCKEDMCEVPGKEHLPKNDPGCVIDMCDVPGKETLPKNDPECKPPLCETSPNDPSCLPKIDMMKSAINITQNGVDATTILARGGDIIAYTISVINNGYSNGTFDINDPIKDILDYATIEDNGGGVLADEQDDPSRNLSWTGITLKPGESTERTFTVRVKDPIPAAPAGQSDFASYDCLMENNVTNAVNVRIDCPVPKVVERVVETLPRTGPGDNIIFAGVVVAVVVFFYARSKQLGKEVRLVRREFNTGTL
jgi:hypothetical protein